MLIVMMCLAGSVVALILRSARAVPAWTRRSTAPRNCTGCSGR